MRNGLLLFAGALVLIPSLVVAHPCQEKVANLRKAVDAERARLNSLKQVIIPGLGSNDPPTVSMARSAEAAWHADRERLAEQERRLDQLTDRCDELVWEEQKQAKSGAGSSTSP